MRSRTLAAVSLVGVSCASASSSCAFLIAGSFRILMNSLWIFASSAAFGNPAQNQYPFSAKYDWFRFYKLDSETTYPCSPTPACLPAEDKTKSSQNNPKEQAYGE